MDQPSGNNPTNNPRLDLLHNTGSNSLVSGGNASGPLPGDYTAASQPDAAAAPTPPSSYEMAAQARKRPAGEAETPPPPAKAAVPEPKPAPEAVTGPPPPSPSRRWLKILLILIVLAAAGAGAWWWLTTQKPGQKPTTEITAVEPADLQQLDGSGKKIDAAGATKETKVTLRATIPTDANAGSLTAEVELRPVATPFSGEATASSESITANGQGLTASVTADKLTDGAYHWQMRTVKGDQRSQWVIFENDPSKVAFNIDTAAPTPPTLANVGGQSLANGAVSVTDSRPSFAGQAEANNKIKITVGPDSQTFTATAGQDGSWSLAPNSAISSGQHQVSIVASDAAGNSSPALQFTLTVNSAAAEAAPAAPAPAPAPAATPEPAPAPATPAPVTDTAPPQTTELAPTGDDTATGGVVSLAIMLMAIGGWLLARRKLNGLSKSR